MRKDFGSIFFYAIAILLIVTIGYFYITDYAEYKHQEVLCKKACSAWGDSVEYAYVNKEGDHFMCYCKYERWLFTQNQTWAVTHSFKFGTIYNVTLLYQVNNTNTTS